MAKNGKTNQWSADALYDLESARKAKEIYRNFSEKVIEESASRNTQINYPIHWLLTPIPEEKKTKTQYELNLEQAKLVRELNEASSEQTDSKVENLH